MSKAKLPLARSDFEAWLKLNRPYFAAYYDSKNEKYGYYSKVLGRAESFKGFNSWREAKDYLIGHS